MLPSDICRIHKRGCCLRFVLAVISINSFIDTNTSVLNVVYNYPNLQIQLQDVLCDPFLQDPFST